MAQQTEFHIRRYHPSDLPAIYHICLHTADNGGDASHLFTDPEIVGHYWAAPYAVLEPELCFVLTQNHRPVGYVLGTKDTAAFGRQCEADWFPPLRKRYPLLPDADKSSQASTIRFIHRGHLQTNRYPNYPAHLHIDILPAGQGVGMGGKLMRTFLNNLRDHGVPAVHLGVSPDNTNAIGYYRHIGFHEIEDYVFGMQLD